MKLNLPKKDTEDILTNYYCLNDNFDGKVIIKSSVEKVGYYESDEAAINFQFVGTIDISGKKYSISRTIPTAEYKSIIKDFFKQQGHEVTSVTLDYGIDNECEGYGLSERNVKKAYCRGLIIDIKEKKKTLKNNTGL